MTVTTHLSIAYTKTKSVSKAQQNHTERFDDAHKHTNKSIDQARALIILTCAQSTRG